MKPRRSPHIHHFLGTPLPILLPGRRRRMRAKLSEMRQPRGEPEPNNPHPTEHITSRNWELSALHALPAELLLEIDTHLEIQPGFSHRPVLNPKVSWLIEPHFTRYRQRQKDSRYRYRPNVMKMALRATCRRFHSILPGPPAGEDPADIPERFNTRRDKGWFLERGACRLQTGPPSAALKRCWSQRDRKAYSQLIRRSELRLLCAKENEGLLFKVGEEEMWACCVCRAPHSKSSFTPMELKKEPEERICIGEQDALELCLHTGISFQGLKRDLVNLSCHLCGGWAKKHKTTMEDEAAEVLIEVIIGPRSIKFINEEFLAGWVKDASWTGCPHMRNCSLVSWLAVLRGVAELNPPILTPLSDPLLSGLSAFFGKCTIYTCDAKDCDTRVTLIRERKEGVEDEVSLGLRIERNLGKPGDGPNGKKWRAQIVQRRSHLEYMGERSHLKSLAYYESTDDEDWGP